MHAWPESPPSSILSPTCVHALQVEDLVRAVMALGPQEPAVAAVEPGLQHLDSSALAALLKELSKQGHIRRAVEIFDWLRGLPPDHDLHRLCDLYTYTTMISQCGSHQHLRRALELVAEMRGEADKRGTLLTTSCFVLQHIHLQHPWQMQDAASLAMCTPIRPS